MLNYCFLTGNKNIFHNFQPNQKAHPQLSNSHLIKMKQLCEHQTHISICFNKANTTFPASYSTAGPPAACGVPVTERGGCLTNLSDQSCFVCSIGDLSIAAGHGSNGSLYGRRQGHNAERAASLSSWRVSSECVGMTTGVYLSKSNAQLSVLGLMEWGPPVSGPLHCHKSIHSLLELSSVPS